jgi:hypothetical protein
MRLYFPPPMVTSNPSLPFAMTDDEYQALVAHIYSGQVLVGIDRTVARSFFSEVPISHIKDKTGEAPYFQKAVVLAAQFLGQTLLLASFVLAILAFSWWAALVIPVSGLIYFQFTVWSAMPGGGMAGVSVLLGAALVGAYLGWIPSTYAAWYAVLITFALWNARLTYYGAYHFMRAFAFKNRRTYEFLADHIHLGEM